MSLAEGSQEGAVPCESIKADQVWSGATSASGDYLCLVCCMCRGISVGWSFVYIEIHSNKKFLFYQIVFKQIFNKIFILKRKVQKLIKLTNLNTYELYKTLCNVYVNYLL